MSEQIQLVEYQECYAKTIAEIFHSAVHSIPDSVYSPPQKAAWSPSPLNYDAWHKRLAQTNPIVAVIENQPVGFIELMDNGYIDCCYVDPDHQGKGVFSALFKHALALAHNLGLAELTADASYIAKPIFAHYGFETTKRNEVVRNGETLTNFSMVRPLVLAQTSS